MSEEAQDAWEADDEEDEEVLENVTHCPGCSSRNPHEILRERAVGGDKGVDYLVRCEGCSNVHTVQFRAPKPVQIEFTFSDGADSYRETLTVDDDEVFTMHDEFEHGEGRWRVTRVEVQTDEKVTHATADAVRMIWVTRCDMARIKLTMTEGEVSTSDTIEVDPAKIFRCGKTFHHNGRDWFIRALHSGVNRTLSGAMTARRIRRIFLHAPPKIEDVREKERRERGKWRGQNFPGREELDRPHYAGRRD